MWGEDIEQHRTRLDDLRREVEALNLVTAATGLTPIGEVISKGHEPGKSVSGGARFDSQARRLEEQVEHLEGRVSEASSELKAMEAERREFAGAQDGAKAEWNRTLSACASREQKSRRKVVEVRKEIDALHSENRQADSAYKCERDKCQQRIRNLRMQVRQVTKQLHAACDRNDITSGKVENGSLLNSEVKGAKSRQGFLHTRQQLQALEDDTTQLRLRREELTEGKRGLEDKVKALQKSARLSDRGTELLEQESRYRVEEDAFRREGQEIRSELQEIASEKEAARREFTRSSQARERAAAELSEREWSFRRHEDAEVENLRIINEYLRLDGQTMVNELIEADIGRAQMNLLGARLAELECDANARVHVLEASLMELRTDINRKASIVAELEGRLQGTNTTRAGKTAEDLAAEAMRDEAIRHMGAPGAVGGASSDSTDIERRAVEAEMDHQRGLLELRRGQVSALEERLKEYTASRSPCVNGLRAWLSAQEMHLNGLVGMEPRNGKRSDIEAMQVERAQALKASCEVWEEHRRQLSELNTGARREAETAEKHLGACERQHEELLKQMDRLLRAEKAHAQRSAHLLEVVERDRVRQVRLEVSHRLQERPGSARRRDVMQQVQAEAREHVIVQRRCQSDLLAGLMKQHRELGSEITLVDEALAQISWREEVARRELAEAEAAGFGESACTSSRIGRASPRRSNSAPASSRLRGEPRAMELERRKAQREMDLEHALDRLRELEQETEVERTRREARERTLRTSLEEAQRDLDAEAVRSRGSTSWAQRRYMHSNAESLELERKCGEINAQKEEYVKSLAEARGNLQRMWEKKRAAARRVAEDCTTTPLSSKHPSSCSTPVGLRSVTSLLPFFRCGVGAGIGGAFPDAEGLSEAETRLSTAAPPSMPSPSRTAPPTMTEVRRRHSGNEALCGFYLQVYPLLKGAEVQVFRKPTKRFEGRFLQLSCDLQRLELWPSGHGAGSESPATGGSARPQRRVVEAFLRVDSIGRVYIPRATLVAVQQHILEGPSNPDDSDDSLEGPDPEVGSSAGGSGSEQRPHGRRRPRSGGSSSRGARSASGRGRASAALFPFDLVLDSSEPWRLAANEVHTFHVVTTAISALCAQREQLATFAAAIGTQ